MAKQKRPDKGYRMMEMPLLKASVAVHLHDKPLVRREVFAYNKTTMDMTAKREARAQMQVVVAARANKTGDMYARWRKLQPILAPEFYDEERCWRNASADTPGRG
jgi:hypothetical protein